MISRTRLAAFAASAALCVTLAACWGGSDDNPATPLAGTTMQTLSTRADMVTGGSALVEVKLPQGASASQLKVVAGNADVTSAFATRADGRTVGLVTGLVVGANTLTVTAADRSFAGATLTVTNHPASGPLLLSAQTTPYFCATPAPTAATATTPATNASGLSTVATDAQCSIAAETHLFYRTTTPLSTAAGDGGCSFLLPDPSPTTASPTPTTPASACLQPYVVGTTPDSAVATTTPLGATTPVKYIVRVERGTVNRGIYDIAVLYDPTKPWTANAPQAQWTGKVVYSFGASTGQPRLQYRTEQNWADDSALSRGFMVVDNSLTDSLYNSNRILAGETVMMMKEYITKQYGEIRYTLGNGCSGGSIGQNTVASTYPGLLDGLQVQCDYPDSITTGMEVTDCVQLVAFYAGTAWGTLTATEGLTQAQIDAKKTAINGHIDQTSCHSWNNFFGYNNKPGNYAPSFVADNAGHLVTGATTNNCKLPASLVYDPVTNPTGTRCGDPDLAVAVWGLAPGTTRANQTTDNVGVQYGLKALLSNAINAEEFVTLNEGIGGFDADSNLIAARSVADAAALPIAYKSGLVSSGKQLVKVPILDLRGVRREPALRRLGRHPLHLAQLLRARPARPGRGRPRQPGDVALRQRPHRAGLALHAVAADDGHLALVARHQRAESDPQQRAHRCPGARRQARHGVRLLLPQHRHDAHDPGDRCQRLRRRPEARDPHLAAPGGRRLARRERPQMRAQAARVRRLHRRHVHHGAAKPPSGRLQHGGVRLVAARHRPAGAGLAADLRRRAGRRAVAGGAGVDADLRRSRSRRGVKPAVSRHAGRSSEHTIIERRRRRQRDQVRDEARPPVQAASASGPVPGNRCARAGRSVNCFDRSLQAGGAIALRRDERAGSGNDATWIRGVAARRRRCGSRLGAGRERPRDRQAAAHRHIGPALHRSPLEMDFRGKMLKYL